MNELRIESKSLSKQWGNLKAVDDLSFSVESGEVLGFLGPNGAGKSTLLKILLGELTCDSGKIKLGTKREIAYFDQDRAQLDVEKTVIDNW